jgi:hypothetical protein
MAPQISQIWVRRSYLLLFDHCEEVVSHEVDFLASFSEAVDFLEAAGGVVDLSVFAEDGGLPHHFLDVLVDGEDAVEYLPGALSAETALALDGVLVLLGLLLGLLQSPLDPPYLPTPLPMHSLI